MCSGGRDSISRAQAVIDELEAVQVHRILSDEESALLERSLRTLGPKREIWRWTKAEDRKLKRLIKKRSQLLRPKPFEPDDEIKRIALEMGRSYLAVHKRIQRLREKFNLPAQPMVYAGVTVRKATDVPATVLNCPTVVMLQRDCPNAPPERKA